MSCLIQSGIIHLIQISIYPNKSCSHIQLIMSVNIFKRSFLHLFTCIIRWLLCSRPLRSGVLFLSFQALCPLWHECLLHILSWFRLGQWQPCGMKISLVLLIFLPVPSNVIFIVIMAYNRANYHNLIDKQQTRFFDNLMLGFKILKTQYPMGPSSKCHLTSQIRVIIGVAWGSSRYNEVLQLKKAGTDA